MLGGQNNLTAESLYLKIQELQELSKRLEYQSKNLTEYKKLKDKKLEQLVQKEEFLKTHEKACIGRFRELFDTANSNILNSADIVIK